ncbi:MAG: hypothetical protein PVSMB7_27930 [Chloroflexota bacterium]
MNGTSSKTQMRFDVGVDANLTVNTDEGTVRVRGADASIISIEVRDYDPEDYDWNDPLIVAVDGNSIRLTKNTGAGIDELDLDITVPHQCTLAVTALGAEVTVKDVHGDVVLNTGDGDIRVSDLAGVVRLGTTGGDIQLDTVTGDCQITSSDGDVQGRWLAGNLRLNAANGDLSLTSSALQSATVEASNGEIAVQTSLSRDGSYRLTSANGDIHLMVEPGSGAIVRMHSNDGDIRVGVHAQNVKRDKHTWSGMIGDGGASVVIESANGDVQLSERGSHPSISIRHGVHGIHAGHPTPPSPPTPPTPPTPPSPPIPPVASIPPITPIAPTESVAHGAESVASESGVETLDGSKSTDTIAILAQLERGEISVEDAMRQLDSLN